MTNYFSLFFFQLAQLLPMEENFLLLFRFDNPLESSVEFMKVRARTYLQLLLQQWGAGNVYHEITVGCGLKFYWYLRILRV